MKSQINLLILFSSSAALPLRSKSTTVTALTWFHWVLVVIDLSSAMVFYFDSISEKIDKTLQLVIDTALRTYDLNIGNRRSPAWNIIKCPKQPTSFKCGFYVMRYMKDVIRDPSILSKRNFGGKKTYTTTEIDEAPHSFHMPDNAMFSGPKMIVLIGLF
ncbi:hypothetical protein Vadar_017367 [Vaccinium darrowii]|uniref:Uncharacterized protein n=1 Tax=Vaccinium darrowii TaxID=229202 RepID=A0ACB7YMW1_9ERIC|nr:hypothetical protein Vadar_017367 [Vaccinium darrowii]